MTAAAGGDTRPRFARREPNRLFACPGGGPARPPHAAGVPGVGRTGGARPAPPLPAPPRPARGRPRSRPPPPRRQPPPLPR